MLLPAKSRKKLVDVKFESKRSVATAEVAIRFFMTAAFAILHTTSLVRACLTI